MKIAHEVAEERPQIFEVSCGNVMFQHFGQNGVREWCHR